LHYTFLEEYSLRQFLLKIVVTDDPWVKLPVRGEHYASTIPDGFADNEVGGEAPAPMDMQNVVMGRLEALLDNGGVRLHLVGTLQSHVIVDNCDILLYNAVVGRIEVEDSHRVIN